MCNRYVHIVYEKLAVQVTACAYAYIHIYMYALASYVHMGNAARRVIVRTCSIPITNTFADKEQ